MNSTPSHRRSVRRNLFGGAAAIALLFGAAAVWGATAKIDSAVISRGTIIVQSNEKKVQHPTGGIVDKIFVRNGDRIKAGDLLVRLSDTIPRANLAFVTKTLDELYARRARLEAERDGNPDMTLPPPLIARLDEPGVAGMVASEQQLFKLRRVAREGNQGRLREQKAQLEKQIEGYTDQIAAKTTEIDLINSELVGIRVLVAKQLSPESKLFAYEREATRIGGEKAELVASVAQARGAMAEVDLHILQLDKEFFSETGSELRDVDAKISEFEERQVTAQDQMSRINIRAPSSGIIHESIVHTVGGVIEPGQPMMLIVPEDDALSVEIRAAPQDIDQITVGQTALLRFTAFNRRITPEVAGKVTLVAADATSDPRTGERFYLVRISPDPNDLKGLGDVKLIPGMPVESFIKTGGRTVISYLMKPLMDQMTRAFRDSD